jgi:AraC family transcriptional regulator of adaptative response / DNA-3-methyladenine glycosylase II
MMWTPCCGHISLRPGRSRSIAELELSYQPPYDWSAALAFLARRAIEGVEEVDGEVYRRTVHLDGAVGTIEVAHMEAKAVLLAAIQLRPAAAPRIAAGSVPRLRRMFDLDADVRAIAAHLARDPSMASLVTARPGLRVFGGWEGFEVAIRSVIGQQVTVVRARALLGTLVDRCGSELARGVSGTLRRVFPTAQQVVDADLSSMGMPGARATALKTVASAAIDDPGLFDRASSLENTIARLRAIRGIGEWTAHYIAMRACRQPDAFPSSDIGLLRGAADALGRRPTPAELTERAEAWRPWRAYAAHQLWAVDSSKR